MTQGEARTKMRYAIYMFSRNPNNNGNRIKMTGIRYQYLREQLALANKERPGPNKGKTLSEETKAKISNALKGRSQPPFTAEHRAKLGQYTRTEEHRKSISNMRKNQIGKHTHSEETKKRMSLWQQGVLKPKIACEHCGKESNLMNYKKWHGDNCKLVKERTIPKVTCEHCNKSVDYANYSQWHGDNCKHRS